MDRLTKTGECVERRALVCAECEHPKAAHVKSGCQACEVRGWESTHRYTEKATQAEEFYKGQKQLAVERAQDIQKELRERELFDASKPKKDNDEELLQKGPAVKRKLPIQQADSPETKSPSVSVSDEEREARKNQQKIINRRQQKEEKEPKRDEKRDSRVAERAMETNQEKAKQARPESGKAERIDLKPIFQDMSMGRPIAKQLSDAALTNEELAARRKVAPYGYNKQTGKPNPGPQQQQMLMEPVEVEYSNPVKRIVKKLFR